MIVNGKQAKRQRRHKRVRAKIKGTAKVPRLCVFRTSKHIYAQLIDDEKDRTILSSKDFELKTVNRKPSTVNRKKEEKNKEMTNKVRIAYEIGKSIAQKAKEKKIIKVVFDRGGYKYHGRVKAVADGAREGGLRF